MCRERFVFVLNTLIKRDEHIDKKRIGELKIFYYHPQCIISFQMVFSCLGFPMYHIISIEFFMSWVKKKFGCETVTVQRLHQLISTGDPRSFVCVGDRVTHIQCLHTWALCRTPNLTLFIHYIWRGFLCVNADRFYEEKA